jgi:hypothetical protein
MRYRTILDLSSGWTFVKKRMSRRWLRACSEHNGERVDLPHCWNDKDAFHENVSYYRGYGSYRKTFTVPELSGDASDTVWTLKSEGFYGTGDVWLNGRKLADVDGAYLGISLDVTGHLLTDSANVLALRLTNKCRSHVLPGIKDPDFLLYGGLAGRVWLQRRAACHLNEDTIRIRCEPAETGDNSWLVNIDFAVANRSARQRQCQAQWSIFDVNANAASNCIIASDPMEIAVGEQDESGNCAVRLTVPNPKLWNTANPALYIAECVLSENGEPVDSISVRFGFRSAAFKAGQGFFLNGERVELHGCNRHECMPGFGNALPVRQHREDALLLKKLGCNFVRLSHYPQHPAFLDACDELGILVYAEIATWKSVRTGRWLASACSQMRGMIRRDGNHPCVILWGMGNESRSRKAYLALRTIAEQEDGSRPVTYAENHFYRARREKTIGIPDVWGCNYELDALEQGRDASRLKCVIVSECSNYPPAVRGNLQEEARQVELIERDLAVFRGKQYVAGFALWCFSDYATMRKKRYVRHCGIVDAMRRPKMAAALMQAMFTTEPFVKVFAERLGPANNNQQILHIFTNCQQVALLRNGKQIVSLQGAPHYVKQIQSEPGDLIAIGSRDGKEISDRLIVSASTAILWR